MTSSEQTDPPVNGSAVRLQVSVGNEAFEPGRTEVALDSSGHVHVISKLEGSDARRAEAKLDPERATEIIRTADRSVTGSREGKQYGLPDEPRYHFEIDAGEKRQSLDVWRSELAELPALDRVVKDLQQILDEQAKGDMIL